MKKEGQNKLLHRGDHSCIYNVEEMPFMHSLLPLEFFQLHYSSKESNWFEPIINAFRHKVCFVKLSLLSHIRAVTHQCKGTVPGFLLTFVFIGKAVTTY